VPKSRGRGTRCARGGLDPGAALTVVGAFNPMGFFGAGRRSTGRGGHDLRRVVSA